MLQPAKVLAALTAKRDRFSECEAELREQLAVLDGALQAVSAMSLAEIESRLGGVSAPGARPTPEHARYGALVVPFEEAWSNHGEARDWAMKVVHGVPTFAADGSQITPSKDISVPVGVVQVGWFENPHQAGIPYTKDVDVRILAPDELAPDESESGGFPDWRVNWSRFALEVNALTTYMEARRNADPRPLCFFDGSLVVSFVQHMLPERQRLYTDAVKKLMHTSESTRVPLVAYVDTSYASDLVTMLQQVMAIPRAARVSDAGLLRRHMRWGDRTQVYVCARDDSVIDRYYEQVCFVYLKATAENPPVRVEFPLWVYEEGELERVLDLVRAECVVGTGYPYVLETTDAVAVLTLQDRQQFYRLFQDFAAREGLPVRFSRKAVSKLERRV